MLCVHAKYKTYQIFSLSVIGLKHPILIGSILQVVGSVAASLIGTLRIQTPITP